MNSLRPLRYAASMFLTLLSGSAFAGYYSCGNTYYASNPRTCPDGSMPFYNSGTIPSATPTLTAISLASSNLNVGASTTITPSPSGAALGSCSSSNSNAASVSGSTVTALASGAATITCGNASANLTVSATSTTNSGGPLSFSVNPVDFGKVPVSEFGNGPQSVDITVTASDYLAFSANASISGDNSFAIDHASCTAGYSLLPNARCNVTINFNPTTTGAKAALLTLKTETIDAARTPRTYTINLGGSGVDYETNQALCSGKQRINGSESDGMITTKSLSIAVSPAHCDILKTGSIYLWADIPGVGVFVYDSSGSWMPVTSNIASVPTFFSGQLPAVKAIQPIRSLDLSSLTGTAFYAGYGLGSDPLTSMLGSGTYAKTYTVADKAVDSNVSGSWAVYIAGTAYIDAFGWWTYSPQAPAGNLDIASDGSWVWTKGAATYRGKLHEYRLAKSNVSADKWGTVSDGVSSYYVFLSSNGLSLYDTSTNLYAFSAGKKR